MKIICKSDTQVAGFGIVSKGETIEWPDGQTFPPHVLGNFKTPDGAPLCNKEPKPPAEGGTGDNPPADGEGTERQPTQEEIADEQARAEKLAKEELLKRTAALGKQKLIAALNASGVAYKGNATCEELAKTLLRSQGQDID